MTFNEIIARFNKISDAEAVKGMTKFLITPEKTYGIKIPILRKMASEIKTDHELALQLWQKNTRETRILASMIADPKKTDGKLVDQWVKEFTYWEICDQCVMNLFEKLEFAYEKAIEYCNKDEEFVRRTGFVIIARLAVSDKTAADEKFAQFFPLIKAKANDNRNMVKKAVNWALRQIGKRNLNLNHEMLNLANEIVKMDYKSAKWIAKDAIRELTSNSIQSRLKRKELKK